MLLLGAGDPRTSSTATQGKLLLLLDVLLLARIRLPGRAIQFKITLDPSLYGPMVARHGEQGVFVNTLVLL